MLLKKVKVYFSIKIKVVSVSYLIKYYTFNDEHVWFGVHSKLPISNLNLKENGPIKMVYIQYL